MHNYRLLNRPGRISYPYAMRIRNSPTISPFHLPTAFIKGGDKGVGGYQLHIGKAVILKHDFLNVNDSEIQIGFFRLYVIPC